MNIRHLIEMLEDHAAEHGDDTEVMIASQPTYAVANDVHAVTALPLDEDLPEEEHVVWLAAMDSLPARIPAYAPAAAWSGDGQ